MVAQIDRSKREVNHSPLISTNYLADILDQPHVKVFDVRGHWATPPVSSFEDYAAGHIPGAIFLDWTSQLVETDKPLNLAAVANEENARLAFEALGIDDGDIVVLYDAYHHMLAGRIWWAMRYWGFKNVKVLNGGWNSWIAETLPVSIDPVVVAPGTFQPVAQPHLISNVEEVLARADPTALIDARGPIGFRGQPDDKKTGHIPGSVNLPFNGLLDQETGLFLENAALAALFEQCSPDWRDGNIIASCGSGYAATIVLLGLQQLGIEAPLFDGSIAVWKQDPSRPLQQS